MSLTDKERELLGRWFVARVVRAAEADMQRSRAAFGLVLTSDDLQALGWSVAWGVSHGVHQLAGMAADVCEAVLKQMGPQHHEPARLAINFQAHMWNRARLELRAVLGKSNAIEESSGHATPEEPAQVATGKYKH